MSKLAVLLLALIIVASSIIMVKPAYSVSTPSVPEFTVKLVAHPYDIPTTYSTNPYTGEPITHEGYHVENKSIEVWIKNIPFTPYDDTDGHEVNLYYNVRVKGHFEENWSTPITYVESDSAERFPQSNSEYTVLSLVNYYNPKAQVDYQVEAFLGHFYDTPYPPGNHSIQWLVTAFKVDAPSGWSETKTLTFDESQTPAPNQEPQQIEQEILIGAAIAVAVIVAGLGLLIYLIKRK
jgi:hypothetical protein